MRADMQHRSDLDRGEIEAYIASRPPIELNMAVATAARLLFVGPVLLAVFALTGGTAGFVASAIGLAIVGLHYLLSGAMLSVAARISLGAYHAAALIGFVARLALIAGTMFLVAALFDVDRLALGLTVAIAYLVLLGWEAVVISKQGRMRERSRA